MDHDIPPLLEQLEQQLIDLRDKAEEARENATEAMNAADNAADHANDARSSADSADDRLLEFQDLFRDAFSSYQALSAKLQDPDRTDATSLSTQMKLHGDRVMAMHRRNATPRIIAETLKITEFLVTQIIATKSREAA